ncbi:heavy-metal-associated domain-containing protein [Microbacterium sp. SORGH_AS_0888]|uniref:heavy-metal-associated domain-containing protein n=1 Tax=Microbacterium sp. SORGH_AS_0888 TaxID=3041791 RepID=UPI002781C8C0|nr:heavy-metal-associated domain-containing protein [Microbacterium sp. SORGH_AS_0888]MDQ1130121.1 copper chaperone [Microbacterium sp. SORGH_AS_0888]
MAEQRIELGRPDVAVSAGCACHGSHGAVTTSPAVDAATVVTDLPVDGMTCDHCIRAVTTELRALPGVDAVEVELVAGGTSRVRVHSERPLDAAAVAGAIDEAGYTLHA